MNSAPSDIKSSRTTWPAWAVFMIAVLVTVFASLQVRQRIEAEAVRQVGFSYDQATLKIQERLNTYAQILRGGAGLFAASDRVDRQKWRTYVDQLRTEETVPGVQGIGFSTIIAPGQLGTHIHGIRQQGFPDYTVRPAGERLVTTSIIYLEPFRDRNLRAFGFDMFSEPVRRSAMEQARDTGNVALSGKVALVQETAKDVQAGTLMYVPVYRHGALLQTLAQKQAALLGWVYSPFRMDDLMGGILRLEEQGDGQAIDLHIYDGAQATPDALMFDSKPAHRPDAHALFYQQRRIDFGGRQWLLMFDHTVSSASLNYASAWFVLLAGLVISVLLAGLMHSVINTRANGKRIAAKLIATNHFREAALERSNVELSRLGEVMAHHFQEPTRRLASFAQRLLARSELARDEDSRLSLHFIDTESKRLSALVSEAKRYLALDHSQVSAGGVADSASALRQCIHDAGAQAGAVDIVVHGSLSRVQLAEKTLRELFAIFLDNALRYRHPQRPLRIEVRASAMGDRAIFRFADNGSGIAPQYRAQALGLFTRLVPSSIPGTGMGLALADKIVNLNGGKVHIEDGLEGGTCVVFDLPLENAV
jgi:CHASE1-domain containing sensor protein/anti-sigma regulatory factor (Ser/Thr protein kinase)